MKTYPSFVVATLLFILLACQPKDNSLSPELNTANPFHNLDVKLTGTPVVKMVGDDSALWLMVEKIEVSGDQDDHPRFVKLITVNKDIINLNYAIHENEYLTDVALGPKAGQLWLSYVSPTFTEVGIKLIDKERIVWETKIPMLSESHNYGKYRALGRFFDPSDNSNDQVRIISDNNVLYVVARNRFGVPFLAVLRDEKIIKNPVAIGPAFFHVLSGRFGGVYSVMDQLNAQTKLYIANCEKTLAVAWQTSDSEINNNSDFYGRKVDEKNSEYISLLEISKETFDRTKPQLFNVQRGGGIQNITCSEQSIIVSGLERIKPNKASAPFLIENAQLSYFHEFTHSTSLQAVVMYGKQLVLGGSTEWHQNPGGISISGGKGYIKIGDKLEVFGNERTETRSFAIIGKQLCYAGMTDGPTTHSHDHNPNAIVGNGFVKCR